MPRLSPRIQPLTVALAVYETWRRLPPQHRRTLMLAARRHGPRLATSLARRGRRP